MKSSVIHYEGNKDFDVIDFIKAYELNYNRGCIVKYLVRADKKHASPVRDLEKALDYLQRELKYLKECQTLDQD